jgi:hypothetical protein
MMKFRNTAILLAITGQLAFSGTAAANQGQFPRPYGTFCNTAPTVAHICANVDDSFSYKQTAVDATGRGWGYLRTHTGQHTLHHDGCYYVYKSMQQWYSMGSPVGSRNCVYVGGHYVDHVLFKYMFNDIPAQDIDDFVPSEQVIIAQLVSGGQVIQANVGVSKSSGTSLKRYCEFYSVRSWMTSLGNHMKEVALDRTPDSIMQACGFKLRYKDAPKNEPEDGSGSSDSSSSPEEETGQVVVPANSKKCGTAGLKKKRVAVRSTSLNCRASKNVISSYARSYKSPKGWSCRATISDKGVRAKCVRKSKKSRVAAYGIWRR